MDGYLLIDKQQDWTSFDVVAKLRNLLHERHIGHAGTLDPMATGLLVILVGRGCKQSDSIMHHRKEYVALLRLGITTDTQDIWGNITATAEGADSVTEQQMRQVLDSFTGDTMQLPPMYSAIKKNGKKLYEIARRGGEVEREPRPINISSIDILGHEGTDWTLRINCSSGTYIRTLCNDIGDALGCGGCMAALRRTKIGNLSVDDAHLISEISGTEFLLGMDCLAID